MRQDRPYIIIVALLVVVFVLGAVIRPKQISWEKSFTKSKTDPYGTKALYELLPNIFPGKQVRTLYIPPQEFVRKEFHKKTGDNPVNYIFIQRYADFSEFDTKAMVDLANEGNHIFIAAEDISGHFLNILGNEDSTGYNTNPLRNAYSPDTIRLNFKQKNLYSKQGFSMRPGENSSYIEIPEQADGISVLSVNSLGHPVFIKKQIGEGAIYYHCIPLAFTNYYTVYFGNSGYISRCFSELPVADVYWDEFFKTGAKESQSPIRVILNDRSLRAAYIMAFVLILLYMLFQSKRRQRIIPVMEPFKNSTLEFVSTVANLYRSKADSTTLTHNKLLYLKEKIRLRYHISLEQYDTEEAQTLLARSGAKAATVNKLLQTMKEIQQKVNDQSHSEELLLLLNSLTEDFWAQTKQNISK